MLRDFADRLSARGLSASSVRKTILPLRAIYRRAHQRNDVAINPTLKLVLSGQARAIRRGFSVFLNDVKSPA
jgi:hypothetical protein